MGTAGDDYLRGMLSTSVSAPAMVSRAGDAPPPSRAGGGGGGGGYKFDEDTLKAKIGEWQQLRADIELDNRHLDDARRTLYAPSDDQPAREQAEATDNSISAAMAHNAAMLGYVDAYIVGLKDALEKYRTRETLVTDALNSGSPQS
jgi:hypothetical protein